MPDSDRRRLICGPVSVSVSGRVVKFAQHALGELHRVIGTADAIDVAAIGDLDAEPQFDLAQMLVERTVEVGQAFVSSGSSVKSCRVRAVI